MDSKLEDPEVCNPIFVFESPLKKPKTEEGSSGNEVTSIKGGSSLGEGDDLEVEEKMEEDEYDSEEEEKLRKNYAEYLRQIRKSEGFDVDPDIIPWGSLCLYYPLHLDNLESYKVRNCKKATMMAIDHYNSQEINTELEFIDFVKVIVNDATYFVTFVAKSLPCGDIGTYQTRIFYRPFDDEGINYSFKTHFVRLKPQPQSSDDDDEEDEVEL